MYFLKWLLIFSSDVLGDYDEDNDEAYEEEPTHLSVGIEIKKLVKVSLYYSLYLLMMVNLRT